MTQLKSSLVIGLASALLATTGALQAACPCPAACPPIEDCGCCKECPPISDCGPYFGAHLLIWTACQTNLDFGLRQTTDCHGDLVLKSRAADYDWNVGYRVFGGYRMGCDDWDAKAIFTHWDNKAHGTLDCPLLTSFFPTHQPDDRLVSKNSLDYDTLDILLARNYQLSCTTMLEPFIGFRALWLDQKWRTDLENCYEKCCIQHMNSDLFAAGIHMGSSYKWDICDGLSVYGVGAASLMEGSVENKHTLYSCAFISSIGWDHSNVEYHLKEDYCMPIAGYNLAAGVAYETCFESCGETSWFEFVLGYEFNHWFHTPDYRRDIIIDGAVPSLAGLDTSTKGSLTLHGVHIGGTFFF